MRATRSIVLAFIMLVIGLVTSADASAQSRSENTTIYAYGSWVVYDEEGGWLDIFSMRAQEWVTIGDGVESGGTSWTFRHDHCVFSKECEVISEESGEDGTLTRNDDDSVEFEGGGFFFEFVLNDEGPGTYQNNWRSVSPNGCTSFGNTRQNWWNGSGASLSAPFGEGLSEGYGYFSEEVSNYRHSKRCGGEKG